VDADRQVAKINNLKEALKFTLKWEGEYSFDPDDPGGETKWGISKRSYPEEDIANLTKERALEIYLKDYWLPIGGDNLLYPYCVAVFDTAVNCGVARTKDWLRRAGGDCKAFMELRHQHYINIINKDPRLVKYAKGWWNRYSDLQKYLFINGAYSTEKQL